MSKPPTMNKTMLFLIYSIQVITPILLAYSMFNLSAPEGIGNVAMFLVGVSIVLQIIGVIICSIALGVVMIMFSDENLKMKYMETHEDTKTNIFTLCLSNISIISIIALLVWSGSVYFTIIYTFFYCIGLILLCAYKGVLKKAKEEYISSSIDKIAVEVLAEVVED